MNETNNDMRQCLFRHLGRSVSEWDVSWALIGVASASVSDLCIIPFQDMLALGSEARLNNPASPLNNYIWRCGEAHVPQEPFARLGALTASSNRTGRG
jgi:4-alpha-glucanotransferase